MPGAHLSLFAASLLLLALRAVIFLMLRGKSNWFLNVWTKHTGFVRSDKVRKIDPNCLFLLVTLPRTDSYTYPYDSYKFESTQT